MVDTLDLRKLFSDFLSRPIDENDPTDGDICSIYPSTKSSFFWIAQLEDFERGRKIVLVEHDIETILVQFKIFLAETIDFPLESKNMDFIYDLVKPTLIYLFVVFSNEVISIEDMPEFEMFETRKYNGKHMDRYRTSPLN